MPVTEFLVADLFCGAGGTSTGAEQAVKELDCSMELVAINHWPIAIETHKKNHPTARHYIEDVTVADPDKIVPEGYLDLLMASPECRFYSRARGGRPVHDQARMNPWAVHRWLTQLDVRCLLVENVAEFIDWGPLLDDGRPDPKHKGTYFQAWFTAIRKLGYKPEWRYLNAADFGDATTRIRFFMIARKDGSPVRWPAPSHSPTGEADMIEHLAKWRAAREIIDWTNPGRSLIDDQRYQKRPLSQKTLKRIARGLEKFGGSLAPLYISLLGLDADSDKVSQNVPAEPFILNRHGDNGSARVHDIEKPVPTATTRGAGYVVTPEAQPFIMGKQSSPSYRSTDEPIPTLTTEGSQVLIEPVAKPFILGQHSCSAPRGADKPIPTIMTDGAISLIEPAVVKYYGTGICHSIDEPMPTITTKDRFGLVSPTAKPFIVQNRIRPDGDRVYDTAKPLKTVTGHGAGALVNPVLVEINHASGDGRPRSVDEPLKTITTHQGVAVVSPFMVQWDQTGSNGACVRGVDSPLGTIVTKQNVGLVEPVIKAIEAGEIDARRVVLINGEPYLLDLRFRMLTNLELARAMGFTDEESTYEFVGNISEVTKQIGNAVPVNLAKALVKAILEK